MSYDPSREIDKLETRLTKEWDRRFTEIDKKLDELKEQIESLDTKFDGKFDKITERKRENYIWTVRTIVASIISVVVGAGAVGFIEFLGRLR